MLKTIQTKSFSEVMEEYKKLPVSERSLIRQIAISNLEDLDEVGSSDVNHVIVSSYYYHGSFEKMIEESFKD
jgi:hypothetical protein